MQISGMPSISTQADIARMQAQAVTGESFEDMLQSAQAAQDYAAIRSASIEFESYFIQTMFREMRRTLTSDENSLIPRSHAEEIFQEMLDEQVARNAATVGGIGLADMIVRQFTQNR